MLRVINHFTFHGMHNLKFLDMHSNDTSYNPGMGIILWG